MWTIWSLLSIVVVITAQRRIAEVRYNWKYLNYTWPSSEEYQRAIANGEYIPKNNILIGIKVWRDKFYFAIPRVKPGVPATLATAPYHPIDGNEAPDLEPYPNWEMNTADDCKASLQNIQCMEIDPLGRMWVINVGRMKRRENSSTTSCPHRLVVFDLENNDEILLDYEFPEDVVDPKTGYLNDIVLDHTDGGYAYITNSDGVKPSIVIFSLARMTSWQVMEESMKAKDIEFPIKGENVMFTEAGTVNGLALGAADLEDHRPLYFTPLSSNKIYYIYTHFLKSPRNISGRVHALESTPRTHAVGMIVNSNNQLFFGMIEKNTVGVWNPFYPPSKGYYRPAYTDPRMEWIETFAIDVSGNMWVSIERLPWTFVDQLDMNEINYRVVKLDQQYFRNYQYYRDGSIPYLPVIKQCWI